jgi:hypothetical protein
VGRFVRLVRKPELRLERSVRFGRRDPGVHGDRSGAAQGRGKPVMGRRFGFGDPGPAFAPRMVGKVQKPACIVQTI